MKITRKENETGGVFEVENDATVIATMKYKIRANGSMDIVHTEVDQKYAGQGIGNKLVDAGAEYARENNKKIVATCPFAKRVLEKSDQYKNLLDV